MTYFGMYVILYLLFEGDYIMNDIDKIKLDVINNKLEYDELLELYIKYLIVRQSIMNKIPSYRKDYKYYVNDRLGNCYAYAFRFDLPDYFDIAFREVHNIGFYFNPGCFSGIKKINTRDKLLEALYNDLDVLNIKYNDKLDNDHLYKVAVFQEYDFLYDKNGVPDFHFCRLNNNNLWSCKNGIRGKIEKINTPKACFTYKLVKILDINK